MGDETPSAPDVMSGLLDRIAERRPLDEALTDGRVRLDWSTYRDRAAALAGALRERGVGTGDRVAVHLPKSVDSFVAAHAVVRLGAVMVPVDWFAPPGYAGEVIGDAEPAAIVSVASEERLREITGSAPGPVVVDPHADGPRASPAVIDPASPAYIVYTSGSTGRPKGIVHTHSSALAYARKATATYGIGSADRLVNIAPLHFDQSTFELWAAPLAGAAVVVVPDGVLRFPASVSDLVAREKGTVWYSVPFAITQLVTRGAVGDRDLTTLRWVLFGGESFPPASLVAAQRALPHARFSNVYGPAEVNQCTFHHLDQTFGGDEQSVDPDVGPADLVVPIGRQWADTEVLVVDAADQAIEGAGDGELLVSSDTMMEGYWRRPDLTAASIVTRSDTGTRRWYRTGDLVRRRNDGTLVFLGRTDHQAKVRGYRIELEAIESVVAESPEVAACAVLVERGRDDRLVALVAPILDDEARTSLLGLLRRRLPMYAVPAEIVGVDTLPRSGVGKVDRAAAAILLAELRGEGDHAVATPNPVG